MTEQKEDLSEEENFQLKFGTSQLCRDLGMINIKVPTSSNNK